MKTPQPYGYKEREWLAEATRHVQAAWDEAQLLAEGSSLNPFVWARGMATILAHLGAAKDALRLLQQNYEANNANVKAARGEGT